MPQLTAPDQEGEILGGSSASLEVVRQRASGSPVGLGRASSAWLFGVSALDSLAVSITVVGMLLVTAVASYLPARGAATVDPVVALRHD